MPNLTGATFSQLPCYGGAHYLVTHTTIEVETYVWQATRLDGNFQRPEKANCA
jgi:hypothetical protein